LVNGGRGLEEPSRGPSKEVWLWGVASFNCAAIGLVWVSKVSESSFSDCLSSKTSMLRSLSRISPRPPAVSILMSEKVNRGNQDMTAQVLCRHTSARAYHRSDTLLLDLSNGNMSACARHSDASLSNGQFAISHRHEQPDKRRTDRLRQKSQASAARLR
jgi:hypothetical protein